MMMAANNLLCAEKLTIYFYNPEINTTRSVILKNTFDQHLQEQGHYQFQPVEKKETFESLIENDKHAVFIMSSWHFQQLHLQPQHRSTVLALRGMKNGSNTYRKILVGKKSKAGLSTMTIATSDSLTYSRSMLGEMFPNEPPETFATLRILIVPKDIDALMAVGFSMADAALATEQSLNTLSTLYKNQHQQLAVLGESQPLKRLVVALHQNRSPQQNDAISALKVMNKSEKGRRALHMLGLDNWQLLDKPLATNRRPK